MTRFEFEACTAMVLFNWQVRQRDIRRASLDIFLPSRSPEGRRYFQKGEQNGTAFLHRRFSDVLNLSESVQLARMP
jgi:hypothetical protein